MEPATPNRCYVDETGDGLWVVREIMMSTIAASAFFVAVLTGSVIAIAIMLADARARILGALGLSEHRAVSRVVTVRRRVRLANAAAVQPGLPLRAAA
jgi:hypothetical protein